jgi:hypothetical protein
MKMRFLAIGALAMVAGHAANATTYINTIDANAMFGDDGLDDGTLSAADSFTAATPDFSQVQLLLGADNPADGGSAMVYLVPDNGGGTAGVAGLPTATFNGSNVFTGFSGAELIGTVKDSSLAASPGASTLVTFNVTPTITTPNEEYWIAFVPNPGSSANWFWSSTDGGTGTAGQESYFTSSAADGGGSSVDPDSAVGAGPYGLIVDTPEPATIAILGGGLAGLGCFRRRKTQNS